MTDAIIQKTGEILRLSSSLNLPGRVLPTGLDLPETLSYEEWESIGSTLKGVEGSILWWVGDWLNFGERKYGETYAQALDATEMAYNTLVNAKWVSGAIELTRRRVNLEWSHHREVAGLNEAEQDHWLDVSAKDALSVRELRHAIKKAGRSDRERELADKIKALPDKRYGIILADPEWKFETYSALGKDLTSAENHYPTSELESIKARNVDSIAARECVLFLWATVPMLPQALEVMAAWGFQYVSGLAWDKEKTGTGYWFMNQHEHLLVGRKGNVVPPAMGTQWSSIIREAAREHSRKPEASYRLIEAYYPNIPKVELNARTPRDGWDSWGTLEGQA